MESDRELRGWHLPSREAALHAFDKSKDTLCSGGNSINSPVGLAPPILGGDPSHGGLEGFGVVLK